MPNLRMLDLHEIMDPEIRERIRLAEERGAPDPNFFRMMAHRPELCNKFYDFWVESFNRGLLDHKLKEMIRVKMSWNVSCIYWGNVRSAAARQEGLTEADLEDAANFEHSQKLTEAERLAIRYADQMQADPRVITKEWYDQLLQYYTEAQVMELAIFVAVNLGFHAVFSTLEFPPARDHIGPGGKRVEREPAPVHWTPVARSDVAPAARLIAARLKELSMDEHPSTRVDLTKMHAEYEKFRTAAATRPEKGKITIRAVARVLEDVHLEGRVRGHRLECDEPPERGGSGHGPAPLDYFTLGAAFWLLTQVARFAPLYEVPLEDASVEVRCSFDVADKLGLDGPGAAFEEVTFAVAVQSPASPEQVKRLITHAERGCHAEQSLRNPIPIRTSLSLNGQSLALWAWARSASRQRE